MGKSFSEKPVLLNLLLWFLLLWLVQLRVQYKVRCKVQPKGATHGAEKVQKRCKRGAVFFAIISRVNQTFWRRLFSVSVAAGAGPVRNGQTRYHPQSPRLHTIADSDECTSGIVPAGANGRPSNESLFLEIPPPYKIKGQIKNFFIKKLKNQG